MARRASRYAAEGELTLAEVAERLGLGTSTVNNYLNEHREGHPRLKGEKRGAWYVQEADLEAFERRWPNLAQKRVKS